MKLKTYLRHLGLAALMALHIAGPASAATVTFDGVGLTEGARDTTFSVQGLTFTNDRFRATITGTYLNNNGTLSLSLPGTAANDLLTITRTLGGAFNLASLDMTLSNRTSQTSATIIINGTNYQIGRGFRTLQLGLSNVTSVTVMSPLPGFVLMDNVVYSEVSAVPVPASLPLLAAGLGALGLMRRRKR